MKIIKYFIALTMLLSCIQVFAGQDIYTGNIRFELPDSYTEQKSKYDRFEAIEKNTGNFIIVSNIRLKGYDKSKLYASLDTLMYMIPDSIYELQDTETEYFFQWNKDYVKRYYQHKKETGGKLLTYTFCTDDECYCLLYSYHAEDDLSVIDNIEKGMDLEMDFWDNLKFLYGCAPFYWIFYGVLVLILGVVGLENFGTFILDLAIAMVILLIALWGDWTSWLIASAATLLLMLLSPLIIYILSFLDFD